MKTFDLLVVLLTFNFLLLTFPSFVYAITDPLAVPNNKFGIHLISASIDEASPAAQLANSNGDWGYVTVLLERKDRDNLGKWQDFFNYLREKHLIPLVRLATEPEQDHWKVPFDGEEKDWADFLDKLIWPTKNRYVIVYNEPNHGKEWGNSTNPKSYAQVLDKTIAELKSKSEDFFVLNAGFDASSPAKAPDYLDEVTFLKQMNDEVPGIFNKLDGWVSHSYPNPGFVGSPSASGQGTVQTWYWELQRLRELGVNKGLPIFITETGWKHAEGLKYNPYLPSEETVAGYYKTAFAEAWNSGRIVAVTPFLLNYQQSPFDHFSFKKVTGEKQSEQILGAQYPEYYQQYQTIVDLPKVAGQPVQDNKAKLVKGEIYSSVVAGETYDLSLDFKNTGQSIWNDRGSVSLKALEGGLELGMSSIELPKDIKIKPGQDYTFKFQIKAPQKGTFKTKLNLFQGDGQFDSPALEFTSVVKSPVILQVKTALKWKNQFAGSYLLGITGPSGTIVQPVALDERGLSKELEARYLLPDYAFDFTLEKQDKDGNDNVIPYKPATIHQTVQSGINVLNFGILQPNLLGNIVHPLTLWSLLPFGN